MKPAKAERWKFPEEGKRFNGAITYADRQPCLNLFQVLYGRIIDQV